MNKLFVLTILLSATISFISCGGGKQPAADEHAGEEHEHAHGDENTATLTSEQIKSIGITIGSVEQKQLTASLKANGMLQVPNQNKASISTLYSGVIKTLLVQPGNSVKKGQVIATIANPEFIRSQEEYISLNSRIELAELEYRRQKELNEGNAGALKNLQSAETELRTLRNRKTALGQQIRLMGISPDGISGERMQDVLAVRSPINGVVSSVAVKIGSYVDVSTSIAEIVDNSQLHLDLYVYEKDLQRLKNNQIIHFTVTNNPGKEYDAEIFSLGSSFEGESKAISVHAKVKGDKAGLIDGMNITAIISLDKAEVPAVPAEAIVSYQGKDYIFIVSEKGTEKDRHHEEGKDEHKYEAGEDHAHPEAETPAGSLTFERIPVAKGTSDIGYTEITLLKEIPADAKIVVKGAFFVLAKMTNAGEAHAH